MEYRFTLKDNNEKAYSTFVWFLFFMHIVAAGVFALSVKDSNVKLSVYILLGFYAVISIIYFLLRKRKKSLETFSLIMALLYGNFWLKHVGVVGMLIFAVVFLFVITVQGKKTTVSFSEKGVELTRLFKTIIYPWQQMDNVILKDNLLTIDFISNKIIQAETVENTETADEINFNVFCTEQIHKNDLAYPVSPDSYREKS